jgi:opacity protein-like surface antigen
MKGEEDGDMNKNSVVSGAVSGFFLFFIALCGAVFSQGRTSSVAPFSLRLSGGGAWSTIGDLNSHLSTLDQRYSYLIDPEGGIRGLGRISPDWEVELRVGTKSRFSFGFAASYSRSSGSSTLAGGTEYGFDRSVTVRPETRVVMPLGLRVYYSLYSRGGMSIYAIGGAGWYSARMKEAYEVNSVYPLGDVYYENRYWDVRKDAALGFVGGLGLEYRISRRISFVSEIQARSLRIDDFVGISRYESNYGNGLTFGETGILHFFSMGGYYDMDVPLPGHLDVIAIQDVERQARLDLSGVALRVGVRIELF